MTDQTERPERCPECRRDLPISEYMPATCWHCGWQHASVSEVKPDAAVGSQVQAPESAEQFWFTWWTPKRITDWYDQGKSFAQSHWEFAEAYAADLRECLRASAEQRILKAISAFIMGCCIADPEDERDRRHNYAIGVAATQVLDGQDNQPLLNELNQFAAERVAALIADQQPVNLAVNRELAKLRSAWNKVESDLASVTKERDGLIKALASSCEEERAQQWEASSSSGGCHRAVKAESDLAEARKEIAHLRVREEPK